MPSIVFNFIYRKNMPFGNGFGYIMKTWLGDLFDNRREQIARANRQLTRIGNLRGLCPNTVIDFLLMTHSVNQCRTEALVGVGPTEVRSTLVKHLNEIKMDLDKIDVVLNGHVPCEGLMILVREMTVSRMSGERASG